MGRRLGVPPMATRETLPAVREAELRAACGALSILDLRLLGLRDKTVDYYGPGELAARLLPILRQLQPALLLTFHEGTGGHSDHCAIGRAATLAWQQYGEGCALYHLLGQGYQEQLQRLGAGAPPAYRPGVLPAGERPGPAGRDRIRFTRRG